jgi:Protein of unknown function (DUF2516)
MLGEIFGVDGIIILFLPLVSLVFALWALIDAATRPGPAFQAAGQNKVLWIILPIVGLFFFFVVGGILGIVYLAAIRPKIRAHMQAPGVAAPPPGWWLASDGNWYPPESAPTRG